MAPLVNLSWFLQEDASAIAQDFCDLIHAAGKGCYLYSVNMAWAYRQLPLDHGDWPLVCFNFQGAHYTDISFPFGLHWAAAHCQDVTSRIAREINSQGATVLSYIDRFGGVATDQAPAATHFTNLRTLQAKLGLQGVAHKASPPSQVMVRLGFLVAVHLPSVSTSPPVLQQDARNPEAMPRTRLIHPLP